MSRRGRDADMEALHNVEFETSEDVDVVKSFEKMGLREDLLRGIYAYGKNICPIPQVFNELLAVFFIIIQVSRSHQLFNNVRFAQLLKEETSFLNLNRVQEKRRHFQSAFYNHWTFSYVKLKPLFCHPLENWQIKFKR